MIETPCRNHPAPFDVLIDYSGGGPEFRVALHEARELCAACPIWAACLRENRDQEWAKAVITGRSTRQRSAA